MQGTTLNYIDIIKFVISLILGSCVINTILSHILYKYKLKKDLKNMGNNSVATKIQESLEYVRNVELSSTEQEIFEFEELIKEKGTSINFFYGEGIYLSIFNDTKSLIKFVNKIRECREKYESNLNCKIALNLVYMERYLMKLMMFIKNNGGDEYIRFWGTIFIFDFQKWQKRMDIMLVKEINKHNYKLESHETLKWKVLRKFELTKQYEKSLLYILCEDYDDKKKQKKKDEIISFYKYFLYEKSSKNKK